MDIKQCIIYEVNYRCYINVIPGNVEIWYTHDEERPNLELKHGDYESVQAAYDYLISIGCWKNIIIRTDDGIPF